MTIGAAAELYRAFVMPGLAGLLLFRITPFVGWAVISTDLTIPTRALLASAAAVCIGSIYLWANSELLVTTLAGILAGTYFTILAAAVYLMPPQLARGNIRKDFVFISCAVMSLLLPGMLMRGELRQSVVVLGFEFLLSAYSYVVDPDNARGTRPRTFRDCVFFLVVNPALVYSERGVRISAPSFQLNAMARIVLGLVAISLHLALTFLPLYVPEVGVAPQIDQITTFASYVRLMLLSVLGLFLVYSVHSGVASLQLGLLQMMGYRIPERYRYPFLATSPMDWWRRWNTYVGAWFRRYVFAPLALHLGRGFLRGHTRTSKGLAVVLTFGLSGLIHEVAQFSMGAPLRGAIFMLLMAHGFLLVVWFPISSAVTALMARCSRQWSTGLPRRIAAPASGAALALGWLAFFHINLALMRPLVGALAGDTRSVAAAP